MNYALIENEIVTNIIWLHPMNASEFSNAVFIGELPVKIGDKYKDKKFYRDEIEIVIENSINTYQQGYDDAVLAMIEAGIL